MHCVTCKGTGIKKVYMIIQGKKIYSSIQCTDCEGRGTYENSHTEFNQRQEDDGMTYDEYVDREHDFDK